MRKTLLLATTALLAACTSDDVTAPAARTALPVGPRLDASFTSSFTHTLLPLLPNVQANLAVASSGGINEDGWIAGTIEGPFDGAWYERPHATLWTPAGAQDLGSLPPHSPSQSAWATDVNDGGTVTGWATTAYASGACCGLTRAFVWTAAAGMRALRPLVESDMVSARGNAINVMGHVAGVATDLNGTYHAVVWTDPSAPPTDIGPLGSGAVAYGINDVGQVVGSGGGGAFVWSAQQGAQFLPTLGGGWAVATAINGLGQAVGFGETADGALHPFLWSPATGMQDLGLPPGAAHATARAISKSGRIAVSADYVDAATGDITSRAFLWVDGTWIDLSTAALGSSYAAGINEKLQVSGAALAGVTEGTSAVRWDVTLTPTAPTWTFTGFFAPIQNLPVVNRARAGQSIPIKFSLGGYRGLDIFAPNYPASQPMACDTSAPVDPVETIATAGGSALAYDATTDQYTWVWQTQSSWAGTCRSLTVRLADGTEHTAHFSFTR